MFVPSVAPAAAPCGVSTRRVSHATSSAVSASSVLSASSSSEIGIERVSHDGVVEASHAARRRSRYVNAFSETAARTAQHAARKERQSAQLQSLQYLPAKEELLALLPFGMAADTTHSELLVQAQTLEGFANFPNSQVFCELALAGQWSLVYSSSAPVEYMDDPGVTITRMQQVVDLAAGKLAHIVDYVDLRVLPDSSPVQPVAADASAAAPTQTNPQPVSSGRFLVQCSVQSTAANALNIKLVEHVLRPSKQARMREDVQSLVQDIQANLPREVFDPEGSLMVTFVDPQLRISRLRSAHSTSASDVIHVHLRNAQ